ncbi:MAG: hypothetical protein ACKOJF_13435, partial [Planctomycetaceae bacterium]
MGRSVCLLCLIGSLLCGPWGLPGLLHPAAARADETAPAKPTTPAPAGALPPGHRVVALRVEPAPLTITGSNRRQQLL